MTAGLVDSTRIQSWVDFKLRDLEYYKEIHFSNSSSIVKR